MDTSHNSYYSLFTARKRTNEYIERMTDLYFYCLHHLLLLLRQRLQLVSADKDLPYMQLVLYIEHLHEVFLSQLVHT